MNKLIIAPFLLSLNAYAYNCNPYLSTPISEEYLTTALSFPKSNVTLDVDDLKKAFTKSAKKNFELKDLTLPENLKWEGPDLPNEFRSFLRPYDKQFTRANLAFELQEHSRTPLDIFSSMLIQIGSEQGMRYYFHSVPVQKSLKKLRSSMATFKSSPTSEALDAFKKEINEFSRTLKPVANPTSGIEGMASAWGQEIDFGKVKLDVAGSDVTSTKNWSSTGKPLEMGSLVETLKDQLSKLYQLNSKPGSANFISYVEKKNFVTFTTDGSPLYYTGTGSEVELLIFNQLEAGMQQAMRTLSHNTQGPIKALDMQIYQFETMLGFSNTPASSVQLVEDLMNEVENMVRRK